MYIPQDQHPVSAKAAIYNEDATKVLIMTYPDSRGYGLPGGHLDAGETPDQAIRRELVEELGTSADFNLEPRDFFVRTSESTVPKLILGYTGCIDEATLMVFESHDKNEQAIWMTREQLEATPIAQGYRAFVLKYWPSL